MTTWRTIWNTRAQRVAGSVRSVEFSGMPLRTRVTATLMLIVIVLLLFGLVVVGLIVAVPLIVIGVLTAGVRRLQAAIRPKRTALQGRENVRVIVRRDQA